MTTNPNKPTNADSAEGSGPPSLSNEEGAYGQSAIDYDHREETAQLHYLVGEGPEL